MKSSYKAFLWVCMLFVFPVASRAQAGFYWYTGGGRIDPYAAAYKRFDIGFTMPFPRLHFHCEYQTLEATGYPRGVINNVEDEDMKISGAWGATGCYTYRLASLNKDAILAIGIGVQGNVFTAKLSSKEFYVSEGATTDGLAMMEAALPLSLDFKTGTDAVCDKFKRTMFTFGVGAYPYYVETSGSYPAEDGRFGVTPFVKAEFGMFAGVAFKVRATYTLNGMTYCNVDINNTYQYSNQPDRRTSLLIQSKPEFNLSLVVMPFSWTWENSGGW